MFETETPRLSVASETECIFSMRVIKIELNHLRMDVPPRCYNWIGRMGWISLGGVRYGEPYGANDIDKV